jgi:Family of unknown function (DUF6526)
MASQSYATHRHNPKPTGIGFLFVLLALVAFSLRWFEIGGRAMFAAGLLSLSASIVVLLSISRSYTTRLQDRIIKLEMRLRCAQLLSGAQQATLNRLSNPQIVALRFASDEELPGLLERAERERLTADQIKQAIKNWLPDLDRT